MNYLTILFVLLILLHNTEYTNAEFSLTFKNIFTTNFTVTDITIDDNILFNCTGSIDCNYKGHCNEEGTSCICNDGWTTYNTHHEALCNYEQKNQLTAFLLNLFFGKIFGAGYWYIERVDMALTQLFIYWIGLLGIYVVLYCAIQISGENNGEACGYCFTSIWSMAVIAFWIISVVMFASNEVLDGNGIQLNSW